MGIPIEIIDKSILNGVNYLHQHQLPNGEFCVYIGNEDTLKNCTPYSNVFPTSLICFSLLKLQGLPVVEEILNNSVAFLQYQSMRAGVWNNFTTWSSLFKLCPADVDNTACASKLLKTLNKPFPDNRMILSYNRAKSGLFYTWYTLRPNTVWNKNYWLLILREFKNPLGSIIFWNKFECNRNDIDAVVNANALFYLGLNDITKPIVEYIINIILENKEADCDEWYRNPFSVYYFFSRNYQNGVLELEPIKEPIIKRIIATIKDDGSIGDGILDTAFAIISLINLNYKSGVIEKAINYLLIKQTIHGNWARWAVYYGGAKKLSCLGSEEMTTGFCLEALSLFKTTLANENI